MPTGYTYPVAEGKVSTLREYALQCSRNFGALIHLRDEPHDVPIPKKIDSSSYYYAEKVAEARRVLAEVPGLGAIELDRRALEEFEQELEARIKYRTDAENENRRMKEMLARVERWKVPEDLLTLKQFMIDQLKLSIDDARGSYAPGPVRLTGEQWREQALKDASRDLERCSMELIRENERNATANRWLKQLWDSLPE